MSEPSLADLLKARYAERRKEVQIFGRTVFVTPATMGEQTTIATMYPNDRAGFTAEMMLRKCLDAEGKPVFTKDDKAILKNGCAGDDLSPLLAALFGNSEAVQENSEADGQ